MKDSTLDTTVMNDGCRTTASTLTVDDGSNKPYVSTETDDPIDTTFYATDESNHENQSQSSPRKQASNETHTTTTTTTGSSDDAGNQSSTIHKPPETRTCRTSIQGRTSILIISLVIFATIAGAGIGLIQVVAQSNSNTNRVDAELLAVETSQFFASELDKAALTLYSLGQFAIELDLFNDLPSKIGQAGAAGSIPFINSTIVGRVRRNTTGVCDQPEVVEKFNQIAQAATKRANLEDTLHSLQFAPFGVICLISPLVFVDSFDGTSLDVTDGIGVDLLNSPSFQYKARQSLIDESVSIEGPRKVIYCSDCGLYFIIRVPIVSMTHKIEIEGTEYDRWGFVTALIQWEKLVERSRINDSFSLHKKEYRLTRDDRIYNVTTGNYDESVVTLAQSLKYRSDGSKHEVEHILQTINNEWKLVVQYGDTRIWQAWSTLICVLVALCISCLAFVTLLQKRNQAVMKGEALIQDAKVEIERNMTAYFAHELRNPLCAIDCALIAMPDNLPQETRELIHGMKLCSTFMTSIMNNLLDVRKLEEGKLVMRYEPLSLSKLVANIHAMTVSTMKHNVELIQLSETENRDWVLGDIHRLEQVMYNLVSNSIKYTSVGSVTVYAGWDGCNNVRLECRDTGPGIPKEEQENLFGRFTQRGGAAGSGLGLAIAKNLVTLMGGSIWFDSDPTQRPGTNCIAVLPLKMCDPPVDIDDQSKDVLPIEEPISVLIVDDTKMNRIMLRRRFEKCIAPNSTIYEVTTGEESLSICEALDKSFDVIIMDHYMNEAGGVMLGTDAIIALRRMNVQSYIIGCSGNDLDEQFYMAGADSIWKKPLPSNVEIIQQLRAALTKKGASTSSPV